MYKTHGRYNIRVITVNRVEGMPMRWVGGWEVYDTDAGTDKPPIARGEGTTADDFKLAQCLGFAEAVAFIERRNGRGTIEPYSCFD